MWTYFRLVFYTSSFLFISTSACDSLFVVGTIDPIGSIKSFNFSAGDVMPKWFALSPHSKKVLAGSPCVCMSFPVSTDQKHVCLCWLEALNCHRCDCESESEVYVLQWTGEAFSISETVNIIWDQNKPASLWYGHIYVKPEVTTLLTERGSCPIKHHVSGKDTDALLCYSNAGETTIVTV